MWNAAATAAYGKDQGNPSKTDPIALYLRLAVITAGARRLEEHVNGSPSEYLRKRDAFDSKVLGLAEGKGVQLDTMEGDDATYTTDVARALLVLALSGICYQYSEGSMFCLPLLAEALGVNIRCFYPGAFRSRKHNSTQQYFPAVFPRKHEIHLACFGRTTATYFTIQIEHNHTQVNQNRERVRSTGKNIFEVVDRQTGNLQMEILPNHTDNFTC